MFPYYGIVLFVFLIVVFYKPRIKDQNKRKILFLMLMLFLFAALRGNGKGDYFAYISRGDKVKELADIINYDKTGMEPGYGLLAYIVYKTHLPRQFVIIFMNMISIGNMMRFIKRYSTNWPLSVLLFMPLYFQFDMHAARTAVSISICAIGYKYIKERNLLKYTICIAVASLFHSIAIITIIAYFIYGIKIRLEPGGIILLSEILLIRFTGVNTLLAIVLEKLRLGWLAEKLINYTTGYKGEVYGYPMSLYDPRIWIGIIVFAFGAMYIHNKTNDENFMVNGSFLYAFAIIFFSNTTFFAYRLSSFFYVYLIILIPEIIAKYKLYAGRMYAIDRMRMFVLSACFFTVLNLVYAHVSMIDYIPVFRNGEGLLPFS